MTQSDVNLTVTLITAAETTPNFKPVGLHRVFIHLYWFHQRRKGACICVKAGFLQEQEQDLNKEKESDVISPSLNPFLSRTIRTKTFMVCLRAVCVVPSYSQKPFFSWRKWKLRDADHLAASQLCTAKRIWTCATGKSFNLEICQKLPIMMLFIQQVNWIHTFRPEFHPTSQKWVDPTVHQTLKHVSVHENK